MARNENVSLTPDTWTELTVNDVSAIRAQNIGGDSVRLKATDGPQPVDANGAISLLPNAILPACLSLAELFPGVSGSVRVWAIGSGAVSVSHE